MWSATSKKKVADGWVAAHISAFLPATLYSTGICRSLYIFGKKREVEREFTPSFLSFNFSRLFSFLQKVHHQCFVSTSRYILHAYKRETRCREGREVSSIFFPSFSAKQHSHQVQRVPAKYGRCDNCQWPPTVKCQLTSTSVQFLWTATCVLGEDYPHQNQCFFFTHQGHHFYFFDFVSHIFLLL